MGKIMHLFQALNTLRLEQQEQENVNQMHQEVVGGRRGEDAFRPTAGSRSSPGQALPGRRCQQNGGSLCVCSGPGGGPGGPVHARGSPPPGHTPPSRAQACSLDLRFDPLEMV